ncbi:transcription termination/antitermination protein NusG [Fibrobacter sp. UWEL]|uniref:transcription termination/antitermination protein NusG n=1 Tax=Fibrobacter sp. UWEL TaxID=1896209 RepID=UPI0009135EAE|nr:transcription termination/antitermination protein NusG [Fibrobacter sp. UWEL]SHL46351.1 transcription antitermination protein nusG [Fibrobacter sp. UWEL]
MMRWYAIHTFSGQENNIKKRIEQMIEREGVQDRFGQIIVPTREVVSTVRGRRRVSTLNTMPTYVIIEMVLDELTQHLVMNINGVTHFLGMTQTKRVAIPLTQSEVDRLLGVDPSNSAEGEIQIPYTIGENVRIKEGPFKDFVGVVDEIMDSKIKVMVTVFGRSTPVELAFNQVESDNV